ncbi:protein FRIGIDA-ESSENTIAL 1-like isoform X2 [Macadamia integrifolia]|uniref:protein FRIGIDA-ESSENTIAL 1-like isoform X2 n=1 Tax=Macadamia integrifolia TaxID=60698 RepID=UPI001C529785|nr:protein FRIGIDA-ESSENTIAL 1-like isoform X2 [Macadamia integrifolia]
MPSSSFISTSPSEGDDMAVTAEASDKGSDSEIENNDDGDEYGGSEEEVEDEGDSANGEERVVDLSDSENVAGDALNDSSQEIKSEGHDEDLRSGSRSSTPEKSKPILPTDICDMEGVEASPNKKAPCDAPRFYSEVYTGNEAHLSNYDPLGAYNTTSLSDNEKLGAAETLMSNGSRKKDSNGVLNTEEDTKRIDIKEGKDLKLRVSSLPTSQLRPRSLSPGAEFEDRNKRPAIVCDFFARGWCVKGSSCRFLHLKDGTGKGDVPVASLENEVKVDAGLRHDMDASKISAFPEPLASSATSSFSAKSHFPSERFLPKEHGENLGWHQFPEEHRLSSVLRGSPSSGLLQEASGSKSLPHYDFQQFSSTRDDLGKFSSLQDVDSENPRGSLGPDYKFHSTGSIISTSLYGGSSDPSVYDRSVREPLSLKQHSRSTVNDHTLPVFSSSTSFPSIGLSPPSSYISSSFGGLDGDREYHVSHSASLPQNSSSPFYSRSEPDRFPAGRKLQASSNDWEPSVPFRPSFFFGPAGISSPGSQYDPLLDSIEPHTGGHKSFQVSSSSLGAGIRHMPYQLTNCDSGLTWLHGPEYNTENHSLSYNHQSHGSVMEKNIHSHGLHKAADETFGTSVADNQTKVSTPKEGKTERPGHGHVVDVAKTKLSGHDPNPRYQTDARHKKESKSGGGRHSNETGLHQTPRQNQDMDAQNKESKTLKLFRAALVDFVKELIKPSWREGHLRKDAHKSIVKKAVEKVISTLQLHQVPTTPELINQYLSSSRSKIAKLVEGYVDKYVKSSAASG